MLMKPYIQLENITDIDITLLNEMAVDTLILDVDNTLSLKKGEIILNGVENWLKKMKSLGIKLIILSNAKPKRMTAFSKKIGLPFVALGLKPLPFGYFRAAKRVNSKIKSCAIVGDQLFTDILGGRIAGCKTILVIPKEMEKGFSFKIKRGLEAKLLKKYGLKIFNK